MESHFAKKCEPSLTKIDGYPEMDCVFGQMEIGDDQND